MESLAAFADGEWDRMFSTQDIDFAQQVLHQFSFPDSDGLTFINPSPFCPIPDANMTISGVNESLLYSSNAVDSTFHYNSQQSSQTSNSSGRAFVSPPNHENYYLSTNHVALANDINMPLDISMDEQITGLFPPAFPNIAMEDATLNLIEDLSLGNLESSLQSAAANLLLPEELPLPGMINTKKRPRVPEDAPKAYKKKNRKINEGESKIVSDGQSSSTYSSEDDSVSQDGVTNSDSKASPALNLNGKARAGRGSATDPQSLYARKRRERINERLRILQNLVPNGTKVDISTMLEEAVHYVKFLQLQIKLLSSDDLWMYAPIAYNGIDICLNKKISTLL